MVSQDAKIPIVFTNQIEKVIKTKALTDVLQAVGVWDDVIRSKDGKHIRPGRGKMRGRKYKTPCSLLIVVGNDSGIALIKAARNLSGVTVCTVENLNTEVLAPGGDAGRLTIFTQNAIQKIGGW